MSLWQWLLAHRYLHRVKSAQGLVEYALILVFVAVVVIVILAVLGPAVVDVFENIIAHL